MSRSQKVNEPETMSTASAYLYKEQAECVQQVHQYLVEHLDSRVTQAELAQLIERSVWKKHSVLYFYGHLFHNKRGIPRLFHTAFYVFCQKRFLLRLHNFHARNLHRHRLCLYPVICSLSLMQNQLSPDRDFCSTVFIGS